MKYPASTHSYYSENELNDIGFSSLGKNVFISKKASIYNPEKINIADNVRIDDFCCISGNIKIGRYTHITPFCLIAGGEKGIHIGNFCTFAYRVSIFSQSDDYLGYSMTNSLIPSEYKSEIKKPVIICDHVIAGASSIIMPGIHLAEGTSIGASSLLTQSTQPWGVYYGVPAKRQRERSKKLLQLVEEFTSNN